MADENSSPASSTETTSEIEAPADYREYVKWRQTGEQPAEQPPAAPEETPEAKSEPQSGAEEDKQEEEGDQPVEAKPGRGGSRQRKIDRLTRENEMLKQQLAQAPQPRPVETPAKPAEPAGKPKLQDYQTLEAYQEALTDWKLDQRESQRKVEAAQAEAKAQVEKIQTAWHSSEDAARAQHSDYDEVIQSVAVPVGPGVQAARQAMLEDEAGGEVLYYLGTHPDELQRIAALQPIAAVKEIGKLAASLTSPHPAGNGKPQAVSNAPRPPTPLSRPSGQTTKDDVYDESLAASDYKRWARARIAQLKGR